MEDKPLLPSDAAIYPGNTLSVSPIRLSWERAGGALDAKRHLSHGYEHSLKSAPVREENENLLSFSPAWGALLIFMKTFFSHTTFLGEREMGGFGRKEPPLAA